jgi:hypothetical protein
MGVGFTAFLGFEILSLSKIKRELDIGQIYLKAYSKQ